MEPSTNQQIFEQIKKSQKILVALPENLVTDSLASGIGFWLFLNKLKKDVIIASSGTAAEYLKFLPDVSAVQKQIKSGNSLVVNLNTETKKLDEVSYQVDDQQNQVRIYLKSKVGDFTPEDLSFSTEKFPLDLIILLGAKNLEDLGKLYEDSAELFFDTPKVNIDNKPENEYFGQINLVDITATSVAEILAELLQQYEDQLVDEDIATCLLAGIIEKTGSFQKIHTTPRSFLKASELVALGARQQEVVKHIYKTKSLPMLKLWGRALARMKLNDEAKTIYSVLTQNDFEKSLSGTKELLPALGEFIDNLGDYKIIGLISEPVKGQVKFLAATHQHLKPENLAVKFGAKILPQALGGYRIIEQDFTDRSLDEVEKNFLDSVSELQKSKQL